MLFIIKKDQKCKLFRFSAKIVKVVKNESLTDYHYSRGAEAVNQVNFGLRIVFSSNKLYKSVKKSILRTKNETLLFKRAKSVTYYKRRVMKMIRLHFQTN